MKVIISKRSLNSILLVLCGLLMENFFYLIDYETFRFMGVFKYSVTWFLIYVVFIFYMYFRNGLWQIRKDYHFGLEVAFLLLLVFLAAVRGYLTYDQSIILGFEGQACYFFIFLSYYAIRKFYSENIIDDKVIDKCLVIVGIIAFIIYFYQSYFSKSRLFLYLHISYGIDFLRIYVDSVFCVYLGFYGMNNFLNNRNKFRNLILVAITVVYELFISKGRLEFTAFCISISLGLLLMKRYSVNKLFMIVIVVAAILIFFKTQNSQRFIEAIGNLRNKTGSMEIRAYGRELYASKILSSVSSTIFGYGYPVTAVAKAISGTNQHVNLNDNGIFAFVYVYGIMGLIAFILWQIKLLKMGWKLYKKKNEYIYIMFIIFNIILMYNITFWWWKYAWTLVTVIMMCKMEHLLYDKIKVDNGSNKAKAVTFA